MRWPDIFFKAKTSKLPEPPPAPSDAAPAPAELTSDAPARTEPLPGAAAPDTATPPAIQKPPASESPSPSAESPIPAPRIPGRLPVFQVTLPPAPVHSATPDPSVVKDMEEADTLRILTRTAGIRLVKRNFPDLPPVARKAVPPGDGPALVQATPSPSENKEATLPKLTAPQPKGGPSINLSGLKEGASLPPGVTLFRRRTKIADVARIVLPPRREETTSSAPPAPAAPEPETPPAKPAPAASKSTPLAAVMPPSFTVPVPTGSVMRTEGSESAGATPAVTAMKDSAPEKKSPEEAATSPFPSDKPVEASARKDTVPLPDANAGSPRPPTAPLPPNPMPAAPSAATSLQTSVPADAREKREFILSNGERILGAVLSETPEAIYLDHNTLGVLTIPRSQIAQRPIEIILINGDRIVGDVVAETTESLFVRHASLGILTVPHNQRSTRVVEAILKDGDRILGEVLGETENFTVIRSATLGTVAVPHNRVAMLNRKVEQVQMKALPPAAPELENKAAG